MFLIGGGAQDYQQQRRLQLQKVQDKRPHRLGERALVVAREAVICRRSGRRPGLGKARERRSGGDDGGEGGAAGGKGAWLRRHRWRGWGWGFTVGMCGDAVWFSPPQHQTGGPPGFSRGLSPGVCKTCFIPIEGHSFLVCFGESSVVPGNLCPVSPLLIRTSLGFPPPRLIRLASLMFLGLGALPLT